jgi:hypothetical protein
MLAATLLGVFIIPALFVFVERIASRKAAARAEGDVPSGAPPAEPVGGADPVHAE